MTGKPKVDWSKAEFPLLIRSVWRDYFRATDDTPMTNLVFQQLVSLDTWVSPTEAATRTATVAVGRLRVAPAINVREPHPAALLLHRELRPRMGG
jgi:hypothetical protein